MKVNRKTYRAIKTAIRKVSGFCIVLFLLLTLGKAGASDLGAAWEDIFPSTLIYCGLFVLSFKIWELSGGNCC